MLSGTFTPLNSVSGLTWVSSDDNIARVDAQGLVTAGVIGEATITATSTEDETISAQVTVKVDEFEVVNVTAVAISGGSQAFYVAQQTQISAEITPADADNTDVMWSSSNEVIARVNSSGFAQFNHKLGVTSR